MPCGFNCTSGCLKITEQIPTALSSTHVFLEKEKFLPLWSPRNLIASSLSLAFLPEIWPSYLMFCEHGLPLKNSSFLVKIWGLVCYTLFKLLMLLQCNWATPYWLKRTKRTWTSNCQRLCLKAKRCPTHFLKHRRPYFPCHM